MTRRHTYGCLAIARRHPRLFALLAAAAASLAAAPAHADDWATKEHAEHAAGSAIIAGAVTVASRSELAGFATAAAVGLGKEVYDQWQYRRAVAAGRKPQDAFTVKSLACDLAGAAIGAHVGGWAIAPAPRGLVIAYSGAF